MKSNLCVMSVVFICGLAASSCVAPSNGDEQTDAGAEVGGIGAGPGGTQGSGGSGSGGRVGTGGTGNPVMGGAPGSGGHAGSGGAPMGAGGRTGTGGTLDAGVAGDAGSDGGATAYNPCPTNGDPCRILPLGDSITWGIQYEGAYRVELFRRAVAANQRITFVGSLVDGPTTVSGMLFPRSNDGHSGWTIDQIAGLIPNPALQTNPDIILLLIGTNDTYMGNPGGAPQRLASLLDKILSMNSHALLVVGLITPYPAQANNVQAYNQAIPPLIRARADAGKHILLADVNTGFTSAMLSSDGIHPNQSGYDFMGGAWYSVVGELFP